MNILQNTFSGYTNYDFYISEKPSRNNLLLLIDKCIRRGYGIKVYNIQNFNHSRYVHHYMGEYELNCLRISLSEYGESLKSSWFTIEKYEVVKSIS